MKTQYELWHHYITVIVPMAEAAGIDPWECVKRNGQRVEYTDHPGFYSDTELYTFALTILEKRPVWEGSEVYAKEKDGCGGYKKKMIIEGYSINNLGSVSLMVKHEISDRGFDHFTSRWIDLNKVTWTPPTKKRTFTMELDEEELFVLSKMYTSLIFYIKQGSSISERARKILEAHRDKE